MVGLVTQGAPSGSCHWLGYGLTSRWGSIRKKRPPAASQMSNLQATGVPACRELTRWMIPMALWPSTGKNACTHLWPAIR